MSVIDYSEMIQSYSFMTDDEKSMSRDYVNQLFTEDEIELLKDYLMRNHQTVIYSLEQPLPIETYFVDDKTGKRRFYPVYYPSEHSGNTIHLDLAEDYELHFPVNGNFQPGDGIPSEKLSEECLEDGVTFIRAVLGSLRYKANWSDRKRKSAKSTVPLLSKSAGRNVVPPSPSKIVLTSSADSPRLNK